MVGGGPAGLKAPVRWLRAPELFRGADDRVEMLCPPPLGCLPGSAPLPPSSPGTGSSRVAGWAPARLGLRRTWDCELSSLSLWDRGKVRSKWAGRVRMKSLHVAPLPTPVPHGGPGNHPAPSLPGPIFPVSASPAALPGECLPLSHTLGDQTPGAGRTAPHLSQAAGQGLWGEAGERRDPKAKLKADPKPQPNWHFRLPPLLHGGRVSYF